MIKEIIVYNSGYINCKSNFYTSHDTLQERDVYQFNSGVNRLFGDIDSGIWGISYLLSMYNIDINSKALFNPHIALVDGKEVHLSELSKRCCYLDHKHYPLFSSKRKSVRKLIESGIKKSGTSLTCDEIANMFLLDNCRIERPIYCVGNERFRAMAAVGFAFGKEVFCFPWLSKKMIDYYGNNINLLLELLESIGVVAIVPSGR